MKIALDNGDMYKVQFVHSSHEYVSRKPASPGGLRQFVDNLALSLRRRVSLCDISKVTADAVIDGKPTYAYTSLSQGFAVCHWKDQFSKLIGRAAAFDRALSNSELPWEVQDDIWVRGWAEMGYTAGPERHSETDLVAR